MAKFKAMQPKANVAGRSFVFNLIFVALNVSAIALLVLGFHPKMTNYSLLFNLIGFAVFAVSLALLVLFKGRIMMNNFSRVFVGSFFIVSGLVKANDPIGFSYKLQEYFEDGALSYRIKELFGSPGFSLEWLAEIALSLSILICVLEIVLGVLTIFRQKMKWVSVLIFGMMLFFTFLTWHTANCDAQAMFLDRDNYALNDPVGIGKLDQAIDDKDIKVVSKDGEIVIEEMKSPQCVDDCGCFGDALKGSVGRSLTPNESFWKDLVLLYFSIWLVLGAFKRNTVFEENRKAFWFSSLLFVGFLSWIFAWAFIAVFTLILLLASVWLLRNERDHPNAFWRVILFVIFISGLVITYVLILEPIKDYRPYSVGADIKTKMSDGVIGEYSNVVIYKNVLNGELKKFNDPSDEYSDSKIWEEKNWKYFEMIKKEITPLQLSSITEQFNPFIDIARLSETERNLPFVKTQLLNATLAQYSVYDKGRDSVIQILENKYSIDVYPEENYIIQDTFIVNDPNLTEVYALNEILTAPRIIVLIVRDLNEVNWSKLDNLKSLWVESSKNQIPMILLTGSSHDKITAFRQETDFEISIFTNDATELKAMARSNPSLMILKKGKVIGKYPSRAMPNYDWLEKNDLK